MFVLLASEVYTRALGSDEAIWSRDNGRPITQGANVERRAGDMQWDTVWSSIQCWSGGCYIL
jgi:hypothetical protein